MPAVEPMPAVDPSPPAVRIATRRSPLARWQADRVASLLAASGVKSTLVVVDTAGDQRRDIPISQLGGQGVFVKEVQAAVLDGRADIAVHSAKDLPSTAAEGLVLASVPEREDPADALVGSTLAAMPAGTLVATGSVRRRAQLAWLRPDLTFAGLRGNIATRLAEAGPERVVVVALAALRRLGIPGRADEILAPELMLPQVGQGALAVECRAGDPDVASILAAIDDPVAHRCHLAERGFLARLGGGCDLPVGALATLTADGALRVDGLVASPDGHILLRAHRLAAPDDPARRLSDPDDPTNRLSAPDDPTNRLSAPDDPAALGAAVAEELLAAGGADLLGDRYLSLRA